MVFKKIIQKIRSFIMALFGFDENKNKKDISGDISNLKTDVSNLKTDVSNLKTATVDSGWITLVTDNTIVHSGNDQWSAVTNIQYRKIGNVVNIRGEVLITCSAGTTSCTFPLVTLPDSIAPETRLSNIEDISTYLSDNTVVIDGYSSVSIHAYSSNDNKLYAGIRKIGDINKDFTRKVSINLTYML